MSVLFAVLIFSLLIFVHEFGHFFTAKLCGVQVNEFAIFMGPALFKKQVGETLYSIRCIPFGGYCAMEGEDEETDNPRSFQKAAWWKRLIILVAGSAMNFLTGLIIYLALFLPAEQIVVPEIVDIILRIDEKLKREHPELFIIRDNTAHMANLSIYVGSYVNGVAEIHSQILKDDCFKNWYSIFPERFQNKTNGITPRRWMGLCNPELTSMVRGLIGEDYLSDLDKIGALKDHINEDTIKRFNDIKRTKKEQLCEIIEKNEGIRLNPDFMFDVQVKRLHLYKRQLMNIIAVVDIYFRLKEGRLPNFYPTAYIFGAKAAPGYEDAKSVIRFINRVADMINNDPAVNDKMKVVFVQNYNCSYAEHIIPAADISEQISPAGLEASGTGNMKLMLNGAVTLGTLDGANVEIAEEAGAENEYIFGHTVEQINALKGSYNARALYLDPKNADLKRALDTLVDSTVETDLGMYHVFQQLVEGGNDQYYLLLDYPSYIEAKLKANAEYADRMEFGRKCMMNVASAAKFSSDRTIRQYAEEIWHVKPTEL